MFVWDARRTLRRFGVFEAEKPAHPDRPYDDAAREVFSTRPETAVFCYGHTHRPDVREIDDRLVVNSGAWLKRLHRRDVLAGIVPPVFRPSFQLSYFRISAEDGDVVVDHDTIDKPDPVAEELTLTERLLIAGRHAPASVPDRSVVPPRSAESRDSCDRRRRHPESVAVAVPVRGKTPNSPGGGAIICGQRRAAVVGHETATREGWPLRPTKRYSNRRQVV